MRLRFPRILALLLTLALAVPASVAAVSAADASAPRFTEITVKKSEILRKGAFKAIQAALNSAHYGATKDNPYKIIVEPGSYDLRSVLHIYSNTTLSLNGVTFVRNKEAMSNMIRTGDDTPENKGDTGYDGVTNITIEGGVLDGNGTSNTMIKVTHASQFLMKGTELCNLKNAHMMEVAAVKGFKVLNCRFTDQTLDVGDVGYEAIQLDVPKSGHIIGCRSEALNMRNVRIEGCTFTNCPRGIGSHTQILNLPMENIVITHNTFKNMKSVAIQAENWKNVLINGNRIENTPRAIAIYAILGKAECGFTASTLAKEGNTETDVSDSYQKPYDAQIRITNNIITKCGEVEDVYADYDPQAIFLSGKLLKSAVKKRADGSGGYPKGDYYIRGVTISGNDISTRGHGIYLENVRSVDILNNVIESKENKITKGSCCPLTALTVNLNSVSGNTVTGSSFHGMEIAQSAVKKITGNTISDVAVDGVILEAESKCTGKITGNTIYNAKRFGIDLRPKCAGGTVEDNIIFNCDQGGIRKEGSATYDLGDNYFSVASVSSVKLNSQSVTLGTDETYQLSESHSPVNVLKDFRWESSNQKVVTVNKHGAVTARGYGEADVTIKSGNGKSASCHFKVMPAPESVKLNANMLEIGVGETFDLDSKLPEGSVSHSIAYSSNNTNAVQVQKSDGVLTGVAVGTATIVCKTYNGKHAACNVIVREAPFDIWFDRQELTLGEGENETLRVQFPDGSASRSLVWKSSNEKAVKVNQSGSLVAVGSGESTVTATAYNGKVAVCQVAVYRAPVSAVFDQKHYQLAVGETVTPEVVFSAGSTSHRLQFQSSDPDICHVDRKTGELCGKKPGTVTITVKTYNRLFATCQVTVTEQTTEE